MEKDEGREQTWVLLTLYVCLESWRPGCEITSIKAGSKHLTPRVSRRFGRADGNPSSARDRGMAADVVLWLHVLGLCGNPPALLTASAKMMDEPWE